MHFFKRGLIRNRSFGKCFFFKISSWYIDVSSSWQAPTGISFKPWVAWVWVHVRSHDDLISCKDMQRKRLQQIWADTASKRLKAMANWLLCFKARSYLNMTLVHNGKNTLFPLAACTVHIWSTFTFSLHRCGNCTWGHCQVACDSPLYENSLVHPLQMQTYGITILKPKQLQTR